MTDTPDILLIDDDEADRALTALVLSEAFPGAAILQAGNALEFAEQLADGRFGIAVAEQALAWGEGAQALATIKDRYPACVTVLFAAGDPDQSAARAVAAGVDGYVRKQTAGFLTLPDVVRQARHKASITASEPAQSAAYEKLLEQLPVAFLKLSRTGEILYANSALAVALGYPAVAPLIGKSLANLTVDSTAEPRWRRALHDGESADGLDVRLQRLDGTPIQLRLSFWPRPDEIGGIACFEGVLSDYARPTGAHGEEDAVSQARELEQLAFAVSHDLQDPLQLVLQNARLLSEEGQGDPNARARGLLSQVIGSAERMQAMIDALLEYFRVGADKPPTHVIDLNAALAEALENLRVAIASSGVSINAEPMPTLIADYRQMVQLFQNLIGNAIKFSTPGIGGKEQPVVRVQAEEGHDHWLLSVTDNGIGMEEGQTEQIFGMFQRLHPDRYAGNGIGLAICRTIARRHGGDISVRSQPDQGSTFFVTLSKFTPREDSRQEQEHGDMGRLE